MKNPLIEEMLTKFSEILARSPAKDMEQNAKALLKSMLQRMDIVSRDEFEAQQALLTRALTQVNMLEARVAELEARQQVPTARLPPG